MVDRVIWGGGLLLLTFGCSRGPAPVRPPQIDARAAAASAIEMYDQNHDQVLDHTELAGCPGMLEAIGRYDTDGDGLVSSDEITSRIRAWADSGTGLTSFRCKVIWRQQPLDGATVLFDPESFLGDSIKPARGITQRGIAELSIDREHFPPGIRSGGVAIGLYKVRIEHPEAEIPAEYNADTRLGFELPPRDERDGIMLVLELPDRPA